MMFMQDNWNFVRKHTFMGLTGALAAFFDVLMGGMLLLLYFASQIWNRGL